METVRHDGEVFTVREVSRPAGWPCRHLASADGAHHFLEYVVSVGPYKVDVPFIHELSDGQIHAYESGALRLGELARRLAEADEPTGGHERA